jgi:hypothetical protein
MDPLVLILVPGLLGGIVIAVLAVLANRRAARTPPVLLPSRLPGVSSDMINMASIKVTGIGGLGLVAMAATVALGVPQIGRKIGIGLVLGVVCAVIMILRARRSGGPMPSSGQHMGANTMLSIDDSGSTRAPDQSRRDAGDVSLVSA